VRPRIGDFPPNAQAETPVSSDLGTLRKRLFVSFEPLREDRNQHRAHRYEGQSVTAKELTPPDIVEHLHACQDLVADLRCLVSNASYGGYRYKIEANPDDDAARDVVDLILRGSLDWIVNFSAVAMPNPARWYWQNRRRYYDALHAAHEAQDKPEEPFNNRALIVTPT
jgi:hypothetical protein